MDINPLKTEMKPRYLMKIVGMLFGISELHFATSIAEMPNMTECAPTGWAVLKTCPVWAKPCSLAKAGFVVCYGRRFNLVGLGAFHWFGSVLKTGGITGAFVGYFRKV